MWNLEVAWLDIFKMYENGRSYLDECSFVIIMNKSSFKKIVSENKKQMFLLNGLPCHYICESKGNKLRASEHIISIKRTQTKRYPSFSKFTYKSYELTQQQRGE